MLRTSESVFVPLVRLRQADRKLNYGKLKSPLGHNKSDKLITLTTGNYEERDLEVQDLCFDLECEYFHAAAQLAEGADGASVEPNAAASAEDQAVEAAAILKARRKVWKKVRASMSQTRIEVGNVEALLRMIRLEHYKPTPGTTSKLNDKYLGPQRSLLRWALR